MYKETIQYSPINDNYDLDNPKDRKIIEHFEKNLKDYKQKSQTLFGHVLRGFDLLCYQNNFIKYSKKYYNGAVVFRNLADYRQALKKFEALKRLWDIRDEAKKEEEKRLESLISTN